MNAAAVMIARERLGAIQEWGAEHGESHTPQVALQELAEAALDVAKVRDQMLTMVIVQDPWPGSFSLDLWFR